MAILLKVKWVDLYDHSDPCQRISHIGGDSRTFQWKHTQAQAIQSIEQNTFCYYMEKDARVLKLEVGLAPNGGKFLKTQDDADRPRLLMSLTKNSQPAPRHSASRQMPGA